VWCSAVIVNEVLWRDDEDNIIQVQLTATNTSNMTLHCPGLPSKLRLPFCPTESTACEKMVHQDPLWQVLAWHPMIVSKMCPVNLHRVAFAVSRLMGDPFCSMMILTGGTASTRAARLFLLEREQKVPLPLLMHSMTSWLQLSSAVHQPRCVVV
jgi:hypothetical protein